MALNDSLANALSKICEYEKMGRAECIISPASRLIAEVLGILKKFGYIKGYTKTKESKKEIYNVKLTGRINKCGVIKPRYSLGRHDYEKFEKRYLPSKDMGIMIISTTEGLMEHNISREKKIGGKLIAYCY